MYQTTDALNQQQLLAVNHTNGPLLILAGAGTGKTKVLTHRIAHIIEQKLATANEILAVTFTNKAAKEMQDRLNNLIHADGLNIGTFHSIAAKILRTHIGMLDSNLSINFTIIDQDDQIKLVKNISMELGVDTKQYPPKMIHMIISRWKDLGLTPEKINESDVTSPAHNLAKSVYFEYQKQMHSSNVVDFGDLILYCNQLFINNPAILLSYQEKFKYIMIDEYQDTNAVQYVWARMLASKYKNICCVGDDDQSIYSWRGADVKNILRFEHDFQNATIVKLEQNYRSTPNILTAASSIISNNRNRHKKNLWTECPQGEKIKVVSCWNDKEESRFITTEISSHINSGKYSANQIAILVRAGFQTRSFEESFISNALPYQIIGGLKFYERMEIRDLLAYIRLSINNNDNIALERIINVPKRSIGNVTLMKIKDYASIHNTSLFQATKQMLFDKHFKGNTFEKLSEFVNLLSESNINFQNLSAFEASKSLLERSGYLTSLKEEKTEESRARIENINEMLRAIDEFDNISEFLEHSSLVMDNESLENDFGGTVKIMTLHAAKGLEFDLVFLPGWEENIFPHQKSLSEEGEKGLEEERRIAYVGITRAKKELYITHAESRRMFAEFIKSIPSRFLSEIPKDLCQTHSPISQLNYLGSRHNFSMQTKLSNITQTTNSKTNSTPIERDSRSPGSKVFHEKFGKGIVIKRNGDSLDIVFENNGLKTIKEAFVSNV
ncbi:MAG: UvrD-helicase domain-containing protein [Rickettsiales bacterium]|nr:UvrD-helicase domain-containing protein [Rickettsiales bacterium]MCA0254110.1 UvrD-helicase domain-containing protein [Pseudomonadota bacterium]